MTLPEGLMGQIGPLGALLPPSLPESIFSDALSTLETGLQKTFRGQSQVCKSLLKG